MNTKQAPIATFRPGQHLQMMDEVVHDPYLAKEKLSEPSVCTDCSAIFHKGRWQWGAAQADASQAICPACRRIAEKLPAGYISIKGDFAREHQKELLNLIHNFAEHEKSEHPLKRIMSTEDDGDGILITTTDIHLARGIGEALQKAFKGEMDFHYNEAEYLLRIRWVR